MAAFDFSGQPSPVKPGDQCLPASSGPSARHAGRRTVPDVACSYGPVPAPGRGRSRVPPSHRHGPRRRRAAGGRPMLGPEIWPRHEWSPFAANGPLVPAPGHTAWSLPMLSSAQSTPLLRRPSPAARWAGQPPASIVKNRAFGQGVLVRPGRARLTPYQPSTDSVAIHHRVRQASTIASPLPAPRPGRTIPLLSPSWGSMALARGPKA